MMWCLYDIISVWYGINKILVRYDADGIWYDMIRHSLMLIWYAVCMMWYDMLWYDISKIAYDDMIIYDNCMIW